MSLIYLINIIPTFFGTIGNNALNNVYLIIKKKYDLFEINLYHFESQPSWYTFGVIIRSYKKASILKTFIKIRKNYITFGRRNNGIVYEKTKK